MRIANIRLNLQNLVMKEDEKYAEQKELPIGIDSFEKIIRHNFYYVDKTEMITELLHNWGEVNLFTRPRRFGKL